MFAPLLIAALIAPPAGDAQPPSDDPAGPPSVDTIPGENSAEQTPKWRSLFDGKSLDGWTITPFGGQGEVTVEDGAILLPFGNNITGVTVSDAVAKTLPETNYVLELEAKRVSGNDFFCGLTLPVWSPKNKEPSHATLILGGWGGGLVGLSSINRFDASENPTTTYRRFEDGKWYKVQVEVTKCGVRATLREEGETEKDMLFAADIRDSLISTRSETNLSKPLGVATYITTGAIRGMRLRPLTKQEIAAVDKVCEPFDPTGGDRPTNEFGEKN
ncbi:MAG: family 16 glycoside hydrolase [Planctomycetota bacterium]